MEGGYHILPNTQSNVPHPFSGVNRLRFRMEAGFELRLQLEGAARRAIRHLVRLQLRGTILTTQAIAGVRDPPHRLAQRQTRRIMTLDQPDVANLSTRSPIRRNNTNSSTRMINVE